MKIHLWGFQAHLLKRFYVLLQALSNFKLLLSVFTMLWISGTLMGFDW